MTEAAAMIAEGVLSARTDEDQQRLIQITTRPAGFV
jgi:hypothetical protein